MREWIFENFPGLRNVVRDFVARIASSPSRFVLASRFTARMHRLLRDAPARFEVVHMPALTPGEVREVIEVKEAAASLETETSSLGQVIENKKILDLPLNGRNAFALGLLAGNTTRPLFPPFMIFSKVSTEKPDRGLLPP